MAVDNNFGQDENLGIKVEGDLGNVKIIEEYRADSDIDNIAKQLVDKSKLQSLLMPASNSPIVTGNVAVANSDNVQFGNNTYFNGPVTIVHSKHGIDNDAFVKSENEIPTKNHSKNISASEDCSKPKTKFFLWHKILAITVISVIVLAGLSTLVIEILRRKQNNLVNSFEEVANTKDPLFVAKYHLRTVSRSEWLAQPPSGAMDRIRQPVPWVIITHTATGACAIQSECVYRVRLIQTYHVESRGWLDIGYNFLIGGDGSAYVGRGWDYVGAHTKGYNYHSISIAFIGTYNDMSPSERQLQACQNLILSGINAGKLSKDYKLFAHRQLMSTLSPGDGVYNIIKKWPHFVQNITNDDLNPNL